MVNQVDIGAAHILEQPLIECKKHEVIDTVRSCLGPKGIFASGGLSTYSFEYWTRDMCMSYEALKSLGFEHHVRKHVDTLISLNRDGQIPTLFFEYPRRFSSSAKFTDQIDNELLMLDIIKRMGKLDYYDDVWKYVESKIGGGGFIHGRDWRDGMRVYCHKATFYNQVLLSNVCPADMKEDLNDKIQEAFWLPDKGYYADWVDIEANKSGHLDILGHALAIVHDLIPESRIKPVMYALERARAKYGYQNISPPYPNYECGMWRLVPGNLYQNGGVWGLVQGHMILALLHLDSIDQAADRLWTMTAWKGLNEWYHPKTGKPKGSRNQLWTAAFWLRCYHALAERINMEAPDKLPQE
jgi:glycogen debranching enzyme